MSPTGNDLTWPRTTERLTLRPATAADADAMFAYRSIPAVAQWMTKLPTDVESWRADFDKRSPYALMIELDGEPDRRSLPQDRGRVGAGRGPRPRHDVFAEIGWCLAPAHEGHG